MGSCAKSGRTRVPKVLLRTLGCRLNQAESFEIERGLRGRGFKAAVGGEAPDVVVVNTCTVTAESSRSSRQLIKRTVREFPDARVVVTGCYAVAAPTEVAAIDGVDLVVPNKDKDKLVAVLSDNYFPGTSRVAGRDLSRSDESACVRATLKVQTGCDELCTFCIVPYTRGGLSSRPVETIVDLAWQLVEDGAREITLSGVHLGKYGVDLFYRPGLAGLVKRLLDSLPGYVRIRLSSIEATTISAELLELVASEERVCRHLHVPLQSGDDWILARMGRPYDVDRYEAIVERAKELVPGLAVTTDVMVGFPGETPEAFENTLRAVERIGFAKLHVFRFSPREGTPAASSEGQVSEEEKKARSRVLRELGDSLRTEFIARECSSGELAGVLVEGVEARQGASVEADSIRLVARRAGRDEPSPERDGSEGDRLQAGREGQGVLTGITDNYIKVRVHGSPSLFGTYVAVEPLSYDCDSVKGHLVGSMCAGVSACREL